MIPNVSAIYRDLATMNEPQAARGHYQQGYKQSQPDPFALKQQRHQELMEKLRNAKKQSSFMNMELNNQAPSSQPSFSQTSYPSYTPLQESSGRGDNAFLGGMGSTIGSSRGWKPPTIRYRHIEDFKKPDPIYAPTPVIPQQRQKVALEREFYDEPVHQVQREVKEQAPSPEKASIKVVEVQKSSEASFGQTWMNRESKFEDKLQSYHDLCRKRPVSSKAESGQLPTASRTKFQRTTGKPPVTELQKAIKMLLLD